MLEFGPTGVWVVRVSTMRAGGSGTKVPFGSWSRRCQSGNWPSLGSLVMAWRPDPSALMTSSEYGPELVGPLWNTMREPSADHRGHTSSVEAFVSRVGWEP